MIAMVRQTPRPWDGRRWLRFLAVLALLALAVTVRLPGPAAAIPAQAEAYTPAAVTVVAERPATEIRTAPQPDVSVGHTAEKTEIVPAPRSLPAGETPQSAGSRAPPAR